MVRLEATCLWSKWGFYDGDCAPSKAELVKVVKERLLPLVEQTLGRSVELQEYVTIHNPIRVKSELEIPSGLDDVYVDVPEWPDFE